VLGDLTLDVGWSIEPFPSSLKMKMSFFFGLAILTSADLKFTPKSTGFLEIIFATP
jgi:hypothetical protein